MSVSNAGIATAAPLSNANRAGAKRAGILVVDDELAIREFVKRCLEVEGFDVITAANGLQGLRKYKQHKDRIRIVVTDLDMPAMNGSDMIRHIFKITPAMKVIVASGRGLLPGAYCLPKPYTARELADAVNLLLQPLPLGEIDTKSAPARSLLPLPDNVTAPRR